MSDKQAELLARLEAILPALERIAAGGGGGGSGEEKTSRVVEDYDDVYNTAVKPWIETTRSLKLPWADDTETAFTHLRKVLIATGKCKKPSQQDLMRFCTPISEVVAKGNSIDSRSPTFPEHKAWAEVMALFNFLFSPSPHPTVQACLESADFYLNKILIKAKDQPDPTKTQMRSYVNGAKALVKAMADFVRDNAKMGLNWNTNGTDLSSFNAGGSGGASSAPTAPIVKAPIAPPAPKVIPVATSVSSSSKSGGGGAGGMGAVFAQINKGGVTAGLRKVTSDMKTKNMPKAAPLQPKAKTTTPAPAAVEKKTAPKKEPKTARQKGTWFVENYENANETVSGVEMKENIFISNAKNSTFVIDSPKFKSLTISGCNRVQVQFSAVVSTVEVINCTRAKVFVMKAAPVVQVDKSNGTVIVCTKDAMASPPTIFSSTSNETNVSIPGKTENDDPVEVPLPEQFESKFIDGTFKTHPVSMDH